MIVFLRVLFGAILAFMLAATVHASLQQNILDGGREMLRTPWGWMTLYDAYFGFITFYVWVAYKESSNVARVAWFIAIMLLGNIAMAFYMLLKLFAVRTDARLESVLLRSRA